MSSNALPREVPAVTPVAILVAGSLIVLIALGLRASFGLFLKPVSVDLGWGRETFALAMALQNLMWGVFQPFASAIADRWGSGRVLAAGGLLYAVGLVMMAHTEDPWTLHLGGGLVVGMAQSGVGLAVVLGVVGRTLDEQRRSWGLGIVTAAASAGQLVVVPTGQALISAYGWSAALVLLGLVSLVMVALARPLRSRPHTGRSGLGAGEVSLGRCLARAGGHGGYWLLTLGFFVCGFHVAFIAVHLPAYLTDRGLSPELGAWSLALIGVFNIAGSFGAGILGGRRPKKKLLSALYLLRALSIAVFILVPVSVASVLCFSVAMGFLWLSTVPLTSGLVAQMFGPRYMATLFGIVFFSHQIGSFLGVWLGGYLFDSTGSYMPVWWAGVVLGVVAAALHWPIDDRVVRFEPEPAPR